MYAGANQRRGPQKEHALTSAFEEFTNRKLKAREKPSVLEQLNKLKELVAAILPDKVRHKSQERDL